ncbi:MAG: type II secretion system protein [Acidobacteriaceae bacterium]
MLNQGNKGKPGFTLIELLVVISIIGLLGSIIVASTRTARARARDSKRIAELRQVKLGLDMYNNEADGYPQRNDWDKAARNREMLACGPTPFFIIPSDPSTGDPYDYENGGTNSRSKCENGQVYSTFKIEFATEQASALGPAQTYYLYPGGFTSIPPF